MTISPETFYNENLKGKSEAEILAVIRRLKQKIGRLKNIMEHPDYAPFMCPSEDVQISCNRAEFSPLRDKLFARKCLD